ncbi:MAG: ribosome maturation factor RimM [Actinomycetota bacterium]|nr:ribosome maturation factor RimM [Actinomycetota bacterium]
MLEVGRLGRAHGVRGEIYVDLLTDRTERVAVGARLKAGDKWLTVAAARRAADRWLVRFEEIPDRTAAEHHSGMRLSAEPLPASDHEGLYVHELVGARVVGVDGTDYGPCVSVLANPAHDILELESGGLVPIVFVQSVEGGRILIDPPEGLFDL